MDFELFKYLGEALVAIKAFGKVLSGLSHEFVQIQSNLSRIRDNRRRDKELATIRDLCVQVQQITAFKGDIADFIEAFEQDRDELLWDEIIGLLETLEDELQDIENIIANTMFSNTKLANELLVVVNRNKGVFKRYAGNDKPNTDEEMATLREIGVAVREIQSHGVETLKKVDAYTAKLAKK